MIRAVLFDLDDTLYPEIDFVRSALGAVAEAIAGRAPIAVAAARSALAAALERHGRGRTIDLALADLGLEPSPSLVAELVAIYRGHRPERLSLHPDVVGAFTRLRGSGVRIGLVTDGDPGVQRAKVMALALEPWLGHLTFTWDAGPAFQKPHPEAYRGALAALGVAGHEAAYVGDNPTKDFIGARGLGLRTVRIRRGGHARATAAPGHEADVSIASLDELDAALAGGR